MVLCQVCCVVAFRNAIAAKRDVASKFLTLDNTLRYRRTYDANTDPCEMFISQSKQEKYLSIKPNIWPTDMCRTF